MDPDLGLATLMCEQKGHDQDWSGSSTIKPQSHPSHRW